MKPADREVRRIFKDRIRGMRAEIRESLSRQIEAERRERHARDEVFFKGQWVPKALVAAIGERCSKNAKTVFREFHVLLAVILLVDVGLLLVFNMFFLP